MNFEWSTNEIAMKTLTIYETNLTLNKAACCHGSLTVVYSLYNKKYTQNVYSIRVLSFFYCQIYENNCTNMC